MFSYFIVKSTKISGENISKFVVKLNPNSKALKMSTEVDKLAIVKGPKRRMVQKLLHRFFEERVDEAPEAIALIFEGKLFF